MVQQVKKTSHPKYVFLHDFLSRKSAVEPSSANAPCVFMQVIIMIITIIIMAFIFMIIIIIIIKVALVSVCVHMKVGQTTTQNGLWSVIACSTNSLLGICEYPAP